MNEKKDLDRLFQEKFKDFEVAPPEFVWENIREALQEKKKRRVIPIWFKLSGVAALLVLGGLLATLFFNDSDNPVNTNPVVIDNNTVSPTDALKASPDAVPANAAPSAAGTENTVTTTPTTTDSNTTTTVATADDANSGAVKAPANGNSTNPTKINRTLPITNNNAVANQGKSTTNKTNNNKRAISNSTQPANAIAYEKAQNTVNGSAAPTANTAPNENSIIKTTATEEALAAAKLKADARNFANNPNGTQNKANRNNAVAALPANEGIAATITDRTNKASTTVSDKITVDEPAAARNNVSEGIATNGSANTQNSNQANAESDAVQKGTIIVDKNIPLTEAVAQTEVDTTTTAVPENELEKLLKEKLNGEKEEDKAVAENKSKERWVLKPQVAPVFYNSLSSGSPINEQFAANSKSYDNDLSFGVGVNYAVTDKITIRSGINSVNLSYATNDIAFYASLNGITTNIMGSKAANIVVQNGYDVPDTVMIDGQPTQAVSGSMLQKTGYIEIPLEMSYSLVNKKFGIDVIGGVSSLFLNQNNVSVISNTGMSTQVGEAQNLNNLHFSTNVGLGFKYHFWDSFQVNFEPMFKYQVNAYSRDAGNFKPYFIGLYSGVSFSF